MWFTGHTALFQASLFIYANPAQLPAQKIPLKLKTVLQFQPTTQNKAAHLYSDIGEFNQLLCRDSVIIIAITGGF